MNDKKKKDHALQQKKSKAVFFTVFLVLFIGGYTFFFTSKLWMPTGGDATRLTQMNQEMLWNSRAIKLMRWDYSESQQLMEVELDISNKTFDEIDNYKFTALETNAGPLKVTPVLQDMDWIVLQIQAVPKKFAEISLRMEMENDEEAGMIRMYTNANDVHRVSEIKTLDYKGYLKCRYETEIDLYNQEITEIKKGISDAEKKIVKIQENIQTLESKKEYQTEEQITETDKLITEAQQEISQIEEAIEENQADIEELTERIRKVQEQIDQLK